MSGLFDDVLKRGNKPAQPTDPPASSPAGVRLFDDVLQRDPNLPPLPPIDVPVEMSGNGNIPLRPQDREIGRIYTDKRGQPRRWMGDSWAFGDAARETTPMELFEGGFNDLIQGFTRAPEALIDLGYWANKINPVDILARTLIPGYAEKVDSGKTKVTRFFNDARAGYEQFKPAAYQAEQAKPVVLRDAEGNIDGFNLPSGETLLGTTMQTAPQIPQMIVGGGGARNVVAKLLPEASPLLQSFLGYGAANSALVAPNAAEQARVEALDAGATPEQANQAANTTMALTAPLTFATGGAGEGFAAAQGHGSRNLLTALIRGFATDAPTEGVEEAGQSVIGDIAQGREINTANALEQGLIAAFAGGTPGAAVAGAEHIATPRAPSMPADIPARPQPAAAPAAPAANAQPADPNVLAELDRLLTRNVVDEPAQPQTVPPPAAKPVAPPAATKPDATAAPPSYGPNGLAPVESVGKNYRAPLKNYTPTLFRETSPERAMMLMPDSGVRGDEARGELFFSNTRDGALGQGGNAGVLLEFDSDGIDGNVNRDKPSWETAWNGGLAEFRTRGLSEAALHRALKSVTVKPDANIPTRFRRTLDTMLSRGWSEIKNEDGSTTYSRDAGVGPVIEKTIAPTRRSNQIPVRPRGEGGRPLDLLEVIANSGGLDREAWVRAGVDPSETGRRVGFGYLFRREGGMTPDDLREMMQENGYLPRDSETGVATVDNNDAIDLVDRALRGGEKIYSEDQGDAVARYRATQRADDEAYREEADRAFMDELRASPEFAPPPGADDSFDWFENDPIAAEFAQRVADLTEQAYSLGATDDQIIGAAFDSDSAGENIAKLEDIIGGLQRDRPQAVAETTPSNRTRGAQPSEEGRTASRGQDFQLDAPPAAQPAAPQRVAQPGLFAPPTAREQVAAREKAVDAERNGLVRDAVPASRGDGELFAGPRPEQQRIDPGAMFNDYNPNASQIESRIEGDQVITENRLTRRILDATLGDADSVNAGLLLDNLSLQPDLRDEQRDLARRLAPVLKRLKVKLTATPEGASYAGAYDNGSNSMWILQADPDTVLHEGIHGATSALIASREARTNPTVRKAVAELEDMLAHLRMQVAMDLLTPPPEVRRLLDDRQGPLSNAKELIAYSMTEKPLQEWLATVPAPPGREQSRNVWQAFKDTIAKLFNLSGKTRSYLDALIETTGELIDFAGANPDVAQQAQAEVSGRYARESSEADAARMKRTASTSDQGDADTYVVFNSRQIKSADRNSGAFDPENPRVDAARIKRTPEQEAAMTKAGMPADGRSTAQRSADALRSAWAKVRDAMGTPDSRRQSLVDRFHGLRAAEAQMPGIAPEESPYIAARLTTGLPSVMESIMTFGAPKWDNGVLSIEPGTTGLLDALKPVANDLDAWLGWMVGRRAKLLKAQGRENLFTDDDIDALLSLSKGRDAEFASAARDYLKIKNAILDVAEQAGLIDPVARAAWDHAEYVPFYRDDAGDTVGPGTRKGLEGQTSGIRTLKGGDANLSDPMANIIRNFTKLVDASMKNRAMLLAVDKLGASMFKKSGPDFSPALIPMDQVKKTLIAQGVPQSVISGMPASALKGVQSMLSIKPPSGDDIVRVMRNGKAEYYQVADPIVLRALTAFRQQTKHPAVQPLIFAKRLLTTGVTTTAEFVGANFIRDTAATWVIGDKKIKLGIDAANGVVRTLMTDQATKDMMAGGGSFIGGNFYGGDPDATAAALRRSLRARGLRNADIETFVGTVARSPLILWDKWHKLSSAIENANRNAVYRRALQSGKPKVQAVYEAKDLMDFSMIGDSQFIQFFADVLPFFNARVQGLYKLGRAAADPKARRQIAARGAMLALASVALWYWNITQYGDGYDELEEWDKDTYWHIAPGTRWHIRIPKPFEIGVLFATAPERMAQAISGNDRSDQSWESLWRNLTGTLAMNPIPQAFLPIIEQWANRRFFTGRPIESMSDEKLLPEAREEWFTSDTMKLIADAVGNQTGASAKRLEHLWTGYTAGLGTYVLDASDWLVRKAQNTPSRPSMTPSEIPVLGRFWRGDEQPKNTRYVTEFYDLREQMQQVSGTIKEYIDNGKPEKAERLKQKYAWLLGDEIESKRAKGGIMFANVREMEKMVRTLGEQRRDTNDFIEFREATPAEKRDAVDDNLLSRNSQMRFMVRKLREAQRQQGASRK